MSPEELEIGRKLVSIFMPYAAQRREAIIDRKGRFVHYTSAASALNIINTMTLWMRNTNCMSDFREVQHGFDAINKYFNDESKKKAFSDAVDACANGLVQEAIALFNGWCVFRSMKIMKTNTVASRCGEPYRVEVLG